jgi:hypothetical protein
LIGDLIAECRKRNIRFIIYYNLGHGQVDVMKAKGWTSESYEDRQKWLATERKIFTEIGKRYGKGLDGLWLDDACCWYPADFEKLGAAMKAGNPRRVIGYNSWTSASCTPFQDFWGGEGFDGRNTPWPISDGVATAGPQTGLQLSGVFIFDGPDWGNRAPNVVASDPARNGWSADKIAELARKLRQEHYSVAFNVFAYEDGSIAPASYKMLKEAATQLASPNTPTK